MGTATIDCIGFRVDALRSSRDCERAVLSNNAAPAYAGVDAAGDGEFPGDLPEAL